jgi:hypothetical protein
MARSTPSGPWNAGVKTQLLDANNVYRAQIGTTVLCQSHSVAVAAGATEKFTFVLPKNAKLLAIRYATTADTAGTSLTFTAGATDGGVGYVASVAITAVKVPTAATLVAAGYAALRAPTTDMPVYITLVSVGHIGVVDVQMEYLQFADATQVVAASQV